MKTWIRIVVGLGLISVLLYFVDWRETIGHLAGIQIVPVFWAVCILSLNIFVSSLKWKILLQAKSTFVSWWELTRCYWISTFFGNYLPTSFGGDMVRLVMVNKIGRPAPMAASIAVERLTGFFILLVWVLLSLSMRHQYLGIGSLQSWLWPITAAGLLIFSGMVALSGRMTRKINAFYLRRGKGRIAGIFIKLINAINDYRGKRRAVFFSLLLSIAFYLIGVICNYLIFISIHAKMSFMAIMLILPIIHLVSLLPVTLNGLGVSEGMYVVLFSQAGLLPPEALAAAVIRRMIHLSVSLIGGLLWLPGKNRIQETGVHIAK